MITIITIMMMIGLINALNFIAMGDWGGREDYPFTTPSELSSAQGIGRVSRQIGSNFVLGIGDNFYSEGVKDVSDSRFTSTFQNVFTPQLVGNQTFYVVAGNHDHRGNVKAEIDYSTYDPTGRWTFPDYFYVIQKSLIDSNGKEIKVGIVMIDTVILAGAWDNSEPQPIPSTHPLKKLHLQWIQKTLEKLDGKVDWLMMAGHYPIYSIGEHGPTGYLVEHLLPLIKKHGVSVYMNGHDHSLQMIQVEGVSYVTTGAVHEVDPTRKHYYSVPAGSLKFHFPNHGGDKWSAGGFVGVMIHNRTVGVINYYDQTGHNLFSQKVFNQLK